MPYKYLEIPSKQREFELRDLPDENVESGGHHYPDLTQEKRTGQRHRSLVLVRSPDYLRVDGAVHPEAEP
jgi:hypothetical protein